jgi:DNA-binding transcriptional LysR family regulator
LGGFSHLDHAAHQAGQRLDAQERAHRGCRDGHVQEQRGALLPTLRAAAAPHREGFKLSNDPFFIAQLRDVVGLYLSPPGNALVVCLGAAIVPQLSIPPGAYPQLKLIDLVEPVVERSFVPVRRKGSALSPAARALHELILAQVRSAVADK